MRKSPSAYPYLDAHLQCPYRNVPPTLCSVATLAAGCTLPPGRTVSRVTTGSGTLDILSKNIFTALFYIFNRSLGEFRLRDFLDGIN